MYHVCHTPLVMYVLYTLCQSFFQLLIAVIRFENYLYTIVKVGRIYYMTGGPGPLLRQDIIITKLHFYNDYSLDKLS